jgi:hypothetical protein
VTRRLNEQLGTLFTEFEHTEANLRACFDLIEEHPTLSRTLLAFESGTVALSELRSARQHSVRPPAPRVSTDVWVPSAERERSKAALREQWL